MATYIRALTDVLILDDSLSSNISIFALSDSILLSDNIISSIQILVINDQLSLSDNFRNRQPKFVINDQLSLVQNYHNNKIFAMIDVIFIDESINPTNISDTLTLSDSIEYTRNTIFNDLLSIYDNLKVNYVLTKSIHDHLNMVQHITYIIPPKDKCY